MSSRVRSPRRVHRWTIVATLLLAASALVLVPADGRSAAATRAITGTPCTWYDSQAGRQGSPVTGVQCVFDSSAAGQKLFDPTTGAVIAEDAAGPIPLTPQTGLLKAINDWLASQGISSSIQAQSLVGIEALGGRGRNGDSCGACDSGGGAAGGYGITVQSLGGMQQLIAQHGGLVDVNVNGTVTKVPLLFVLVGNEGNRALHLRGGGGGAASWVLGKRPTDIAQKDMMFPSADTNAALNAEVNPSGAVDDLVFVIAGGGGGGGGARVTGGGKHGGQGGRMNEVGPVTTGDYTAPGEKGNGSHGGGGGSAGGPGVGGDSGANSEENAGKPGIGGMGGRDADTAGWVGSVFTWAAGMGGSTGGDEAEGGGGGGGWGGGGGGSQVDNNDIGTQGHGGGGGGTWARRSVATAPSLPTAYNLLGNGFSLSDAGYSRVIISFSVVANPVAAPGPVTSPGPAGPPPGVGASAESTAMAALMTGLAKGVGQGIGHSAGDFAINWGLTALGLGPLSPATALNLDQVEQSLQAIENELGDIEDLLQEAACQNAADVGAIQTALNAIDIRVGRGDHPVNGSYLALVRDAQRDIPVATDDLEALFEAVISGDAQFGPLEQLLVELDNALRDQGNAEQLISACGLLVDPPDAATDQWDDRSYFKQLHDIVGYYAEYQARAALVITEAYHWKALQAWIDAGGETGSLPPENVASICDDATGDVLRYCAAAADAFESVRTNLRAQYGEVGAPYSSGPPADPDAPFLWDPADPVVQIDNGTGYVWVKDIDDFFERGGYSSTCRASTSAKPCGPGVGHYDHTTFERYGSDEPMRYGANGGYTTWVPAPVKAWEALIAKWSGNSTTLAKLMEETHGFSGASTPRVYFTGDVSTKRQTFGDWTDLYTDVVELACFVVTPMTKGDSEQPFCDEHLGKLVHAATDHQFSNAPCLNLKNTPIGTLDDAGIEKPFFTFLFNRQDYECKSAGHPLGLTFYPGPPGWLLEYEVYSNRSDSDYTTGVLSIDRSQYHAQYHWPVLDAHAVTCTTEPATGETRSRYALHGRTQVPRLCGADFDAWFEKWVAPPAPVGPTPEVSPPEPIVVEVPRGATADRAPHEVTTPVDFAHLLAGALVWDCSHESGMPFQLGTTIVRCTVTDGNGASVEQRFTVQVRYPFGFRDDLRRGSMRARAGSTIEVEFTLGGDRGRSPLAASPTSRPVDCATGEALGEAEPITTRGRRLLEYDRGDREYELDWRTDRAWRGQCRQLVLELVDGSVHTALIQFRSR